MWGEGAAGAGEDQLGPGLWGILPGEARVVFVAVGEVGQAMCAGCVRGGAGTGWWRGAVFHPVDLPCWAMIDLSVYQD
ncbi:hypothetical protein HMPREF0290_0136 [Corynebacterium efficiens YS-314]|nr:hypothetical protein HMPREF0290_0136 [Corynebacterium efficiens YS-314]